MTNLPSGNKRTSPIAGSLDGFDTDLRTNYARLQHELRSAFIRPGQRKDALDRFFATALKDVGKLRGQDRVAALADRKDALDRAAVSTAKTITALERQLAKTVAEAGELREALAGAQADLAMARERHDTPPVSLLEAPAPPVAPTMAPDGPRNDGEATGLPVRSPGKAGHTPRRTGRPGAAK